MPFVLVYFSCLWFAINNSVNGHARPYRSEIMLSPRDFVIWHFLLLNHIEHSRNGSREVFPSLLIVIGIILVVSPFTLYKRISR